MLMHLGRRLIVLLFLGSTLAACSSMSGMTGATKSLANAPKAVPVGTTRPAVVPVIHVGAAAGRTPDDTCRGLADQNFGGGLVVDGQIDVVGAFSATASQVAAWREQVAKRDGLTITSGFRSMPAGSAMTVCFLDGSFQDPAGGTDAGRPTRMVVTVDAERAHAISWGPRAGIPVEDPGGF